MIKYLKTWLKLFSLLLVIMFVWFIVHESAHALVCELNGFDASLKQVMPHPEINCDGIVQDKLMISSFNYFIFAIIPYLIGLVILLFLYNKKGFLVYPVTFILLLDVSYNFLISPFRPTDFAKIAIVNKYLYLVSVLIVFIEWFVGYRILKKNYKGFRKWVRNSIGKKD